MGLLRDLESNPRGEMMKDRDQVKKEIKRLMKQKDISLEELGVKKKKPQPSEGQSTPSNPISEKLNKAKKTLNEGSGVTRGRITRGSIVGSGSIIGEGKTVSEKMKSITGSPILGRGKRDISDRIFNRKRRRRPRKKKEKEEGKK